MSNRILVVEDDILIQMAIVDALEHAGFKVVGTAETADDAEEAAKKAQPEIVLMDLNLKGSRDGVAAAASIRALHPDAEVIFLTAHADAMNVERMKAVGAKRILSKPYSDHELVAVLKAA